MTVTRAFLIVILSGVGFAGAGGLIGYALGVLAPAYYRGVFSNGRQPWFDPAEVGLGLGVTQGAACGVLVGAVVVLAVAWCASRRGVAPVEPVAWPGGKSLWEGEHRPLVQKDKG